MYEEKYKDGKVERTGLALKTARLQRGLSRREASNLLGWSPVAFEQIENGRCNLSEKRLARILAAYGYSRDHFNLICREPKLYLARVCETGSTDITVARKPRRNHYKIVTKKARALRILRKRKELSQHQASRLCGYVPSGFGHIEVGRIDIKKPRIEHILKCLGYEWRDFETLMNATILRDEVLEETRILLDRLSDDALLSANNVIKVLLK